MLDIEIVEAPTAVATDILSRADAKKHLRISPSNTALDDLIDDAIEETVHDLHGIGGKLNRCILPTTFRMYLRDFPGLDEDGNYKPILLPYPPLIEVLAVTIEDGSSPANTVDAADYVVKSGMLVPEIHPVDSWPTVTPAPRAVSVTYRCGYESYPPQLRRLVKILMAHMIENAEATILEPRVLQVSRKVEFGHYYLMSSLRVPLGYDWNE